MKREIKADKNLESRVSLSAPWYTYYHELEALFGDDTEITLDFNEDEMLIILCVRNEEKAYALSRLLPTTIAFGSISARVQVIPANMEYESDYDLLLKAFKDNPVFAAGINEDITDMNYILFKKKVVQFFNDQFNDPNGVKSTLYQDIADDVFSNVSGVFFSTESNDKEKND